jgi:hypothetical protein
MQTIFYFGSKMDEKQWIMHQKIRQKNPDLERPGLW